MSSLKPDPESAGNVEISPPDLTTVMNTMQVLRGGGAPVLPEDGAVMLQSLLKLSEFKEIGLKPEDAASILVDALEEFDLYYEKGFRLHPPPMTSLHLVVFGVFLPSEEAAPLRFNPGVFDTNVVAPYLEANPKAAVLVDQAIEMGSRMAPEQDEGDADDPFRDLSAAEKRAWRQSMNEIEVNAVIRNAKGRTFAIVNNSTVSMGGVVTVERDGQTFSWRMVDTDGQDVIWEPVLDTEGDFLIVC